MKEKPVTLFGRRMRFVIDKGPTYKLAGRVVWQALSGHWRGECPDTMSNTLPKKSPHAAARALERKIESQWRRLGKMIEGKNNAR